MSQHLTNITSQYNNTENCKVKTTVKRMTKAMSDVLRINVRNRPVYTGTVGRLIFVAHETDNFQFTTDYLGRLSKQLQLLEQMYGTTFKIAVSTVGDMSAKMNHDVMSNISENVTDLEKKRLNEQSMLLWVVCWNKGEFSYDVL